MQHASGDIPGGDVPREDGFLNVNQQWLGGITPVVSAQNILLCSFLGFWATESVTVCGNSLGVQTTQTKSWMLLPCYYYETLCPVYMWDIFKYGFFNVIAAIFLQAPKFKKGCYPVLGLEK